MFKELHRTSKIFNDNIPPIELYRHKFLIAIYYVKEAVDYDVGFKTKITPIRVWRHE